MPKAGLRLIATPNSRCPRLRETFLPRAPPPTRHLLVTSACHAATMDNSDVIHSHNGRTISSNSELSSGDFIEAYCKDTLVHRGDVTDIAPNHELFWIQDVLTGGRRLLDIAELEIRKPARAHLSF